MQSGKVERKLLVNTEKTGEEIVIQGQEYGNSCECVTVDKTVTCGTFKSQKNTLNVLGLVRKGVENICQILLTMI